MDFSSDGISLTFLAYTRKMSPLKAILDEF